MVHLIAYAGVEADEFFWCEYFLEGMSAECPQYY